MMSAPLTLGPAFILRAPTLAAPLSEWKVVAHTQGDVTVIPSPEIAYVHADQAGGSPVDGRGRWGFTFAFSALERDLQTMERVLPGSVRSTTTPDALGFKTRTHRFTPAAYAIVPEDDYAEGNPGWFFSPFAHWFPEAIIEAAGPISKKGRIEQTGEAEVSYSVTMRALGDAPATLGQPWRFGSKALGIDLLYSAAQQSVSPLVGGPGAFTRDGAAYLTAPPYTLVPAGSPRFQQGALLLEPQRTNLVANYADFITGWSALSSATPAIEANVVAGPFSATQDADKITFAGPNSWWGANAAYVNGETYQISCYVRVADGGASFDAQLGFYTTTAGGLQSFVTVPVTALWQRVTATITVPANEPASSRMVVMREAPGHATRALYVWGMQVEAGGDTTSPIPSSGGALTRPADVLDIPYAMPYDPAVGLTLSVEVTPLFGVPGAEAQLLRLGTDGGQHLRLRQIANGSYQAAFWGANAAYAFEVGTPPATNRKNQRTRLTVALGGDLPHGVRFWVAGTEYSPATPQVSGWTAQPVQGQVLRFGGSPYLLHSAAVVRGVFTDAEMAALLATL